jgi:hypothetical protein
MSYLRLTSAGLGALLLSMLAPVAGSAAPFGEWRPGSDHGSLRGRHLPPHDGVGNAGANGLACRKIQLCRSCGLEDAERNATLRRKRLRRREAGMCWRERAGEDRGVHHTPGRSGPPRHDL